MVLILLDASGVVSGLASGVVGGRGAEADAGPPLLGAPAIGSSLADRWQRLAAQGDAAAAALHRGLLALLGGQSTAFEHREGDWRLRLQACHPGSAVAAVLVVDRLPDRVDGRPDHLSADRMADRMAEHLRRRHAGRRVLLAEDDDVIQHAMVQLLSAAGLEVDTADDGLEAVERACRSTPALIVLDLRMPRLDGIAAARTLRTLPGLQATPILAVSAHAGDEDRQACRAVGVNDVLAKPVDVARLYERLLHWLDAPPAAAPAGTPPIDAALVPLLGVDGIDAAAGLAAIGGRPAVYRRLLRVFVDTHAGDGQRLLQQVQRGDAAAAAALAHRLRGSAATLGLIDVETAAAALEGAIDDAADPAALPLLAQAVAATLADALAHLQAALLP